MRSITVPTSLLVAPLAISIAAIAVLIGIPGNERVWQAGSWILVFATLALVVVLGITSYLLIRVAAARTWPRIAAFTAGVLYVSLLVLGSLF